MSYWTEVSFIWGEAPPDFAAVDSSLRRAVSDIGCAESVYTDLSTVLRGASVTADLRLDGQVIRGLIATMMHPFPASTLRVHGTGEAEGDEWFCEYKGAVVITESGPGHDPFEIKKTDGIIGHMAALGAAERSEKGKQRHPPKSVRATVGNDIQHEGQGLSELPILAEGMDWVGAKNLTPYPFDLPWILAFPFVSVPIAKKQSVGKNLCRPLQNFPNALSNAEVMAWLFGINKGLHDKNHGQAALSFEPRIDGISLSLTYLKGTLHSAVLPIDGRLIAIHPDRLGHIQDLPRSLTAKAPPAVVGVDVCLFLPRQAQHNASLDRAAQKSAIHAFLTKDHVDTASPEIKCFAIELSCVTVYVAKTHLDAMKFLVDMGFKASYRMAKADYSSYEDRAFSALFADRSSLEYPVAGAMYRVNEFDKRMLLSQMSRPLPWALARSFDAF